MGARRTAAAGAGEGTAVVDDAGGGGSGAGSRSDRDGSSMVDAVVDVGSRDAAVRGGGPPARPTNARTTTSARPTTTTAARTAVRHVMLPGRRRRWRGFRGSDEAEVDAADVHDLAGPSPIDG